MSKSTHLKCVYASDTDYTRNVIATDLLVRLKWTSAWVTSSLKKKKCHSRPAFCVYSGHQFGCWKLHTLMAIAKSDNYKDWWPNSLCHAHARPWQITLRWQGWKSFLLLQGLVKNWHLHSLNADNTMPLSLSSVLWLRPNHTKNGVQQDEKGEYINVVSVLSPRLKILVTLRC